MSLSPLNPDCSPRIGDYDMGIKHQAPKRRSLNASATREKRLISTTHTQDGKKGEAGFHARSPVIRWNQRMSRSSTARCSLGVRIKSLLFSHDENACPLIESLLLICSSKDRQTDWRTANTHADSADDRLSARKECTLSCVLKTLNSLTTSGTKRRLNEFFSLSLSLETTQQAPHFAQLIDHTITGT